MEVKHAVEHGKIPMLVDEATRVRRDLVKHGYVEMRTGEKSWNDDDRTYSEVPRALYAGSVVGLLPLSEDSAVLVSPKFPASLAKMVDAIGGHTVALDLLRAYSEGTPDQAADWMVDRLASDFVEAAGGVLRQGLLRTYVERRTTTSSPKGRILMGPTMARHESRGIDYLVDVAYFERTEENAPNQALLEAAHWVVQWTAGRKTALAGNKKQAQENDLVWRRAIELLHALRFVPRDREGRYKNDREVRLPRKLPDARSAYRRALPLALALVERRGFSLDAADSDLALSSLLIKTDEVFEEFVRLRLKQYLPDRSLNVVDGNAMERRYLYEAASQVPGVHAVMLPRGDSIIQPDVLIEAGQLTLLVLDVKYKEIKKHASRSDVEQLITYAHRLDCPRVVSIHPTQQGQRPGLFASGSIGPTTVYSYRVNLAADDLEEEMRIMAHVLGSLC